MGGVGGRALRCHSWRCHHARAPRLTSHRRRSSQSGYDSDAHGAIGCYRNPKPTITERRMFRTNHATVPTDYKSHGLPLRRRRFHCGLVRRRRGEAVGLEKDPVPDARTLGDPHIQRMCRPCLFVSRPGGCNGGDACAFCHAHPTKRVRARPPRQERLRCKEQLRSMLDAGHDPEGGGISRLWHDSGVRSGGPSEGRLVVSLRVTRVYIVECGSPLAVKLRRSSPTASSGDQHHSNAPLCSSGNPAAVRM